MDNISPKVSVIIPAYNSALFIEKSIKSVLRQSFSDLELIIIDDGSKDNTKDIVHSFIEIDQRVKYLYQENSGGAAKPKNTAFKLCRGDYIAYLDHDDEWLEDKIKEQIDSMQSNPKVALITCHSHIINKDKKNSIHKVKELKNFSDFLNNPSAYIFSNSSVLIRKETIEKVGPRDENLKIFEDFDYFLRIIKAGYQIKFVDKFLLNYYFHKNNLSKDKKRITDYENFLIKHSDSFLTQDSFTRANYYRHLGTSRLLNGEKRKSLNYFIKAIGIKPDLKNFITFFTALVLSKSLYEKILNLKIELTNK